MRHGDPHFNSDPFIHAHDDAAEAKARAELAVGDPDVDRGGERAARAEADAAVDADTAAKDKHIGSQNVERDDVDVDEDGMPTVEEARKRMPPSHVGAGAVDMTKVRGGTQPVTGKTTKTTKTTDKA